MHNLHDLEVGVFLVIGIVTVMGLAGYKGAIKLARGDPKLIRQQ
jgi:hypothetical protein